MPSIKTLAKSLCVIGPVAAMYASPAGAVTQSLVEQRMLPQEGLAIALASTVLQSQLNILIQSFVASKGKCSVLSGKEGSIELTSVKTVSKKETKTTVEVFFDTKCKSLYITADADITETSKLVNVVETASYKSPTGFDLGTLSVNENATATDAGGIGSVSGVGTFIASGSKRKSYLGLNCDLSKLTDNKTPPFPCEGGIAQDFPKLKEALASVTPLTLTLEGNQGSKGVKFSGTKSDMVTGAIGALKIIAPTVKKLAISGSSKPFGTAVTKGSAAAFSLFPPKPTSWTIVDSAHDATFSIAVQSNADRNSAGKVTQTSTGKVLAEFKVDQSGTGSIKYSDKSTAAITSWLLSE
jgi:hypothetical protein